MKRLFLLCCCLAAAAPLSARDESLGRAVRAVADSVRATVGVAVVFEEGDTLVVNNACRYPTMSVYKFHQALAVLDRLGRSGLPLTTRIPVLRSASRYVVAAARSLSRGRSVHRGGTAGVQRCAER